MHDIIKVAIRNIGRNKRRTLITVITVFIGVIVSIATRGLLNGLQGEIISNLTRKIYGDLQIHRSGYQDSLESQPYKFLVPEHFEALNEEQAPRIRVMGLINHQKSQSTTPVVISGIDSARESIVCPRLATSVQLGTMLDSSKEVLPKKVVDENLEEAKGLNEKNATVSNEESQQKVTRAAGYAQIMITPSLQHGLGAEIGDEMVILISDKDNMQQAIVATLVAVVDVATPGAATRMAWMDLKTLQRTLNIPGEASEIALRTSPTRNVEQEKSRMARIVGDNFVVESWKDLGGFLRDAMALQNIVFSAVVVILFAIVLSAIVNTSLMTVMERTREIGTLMALGYRRKHILLMFLAESAAIGASGGVLGLFFGEIVLAIFRLHGIPMRLPGQTVPTIIFPEVSSSFLLITLSLSILAAVIAGFVPARRASHLKPVDALNSN